MLSHNTQTIIAELIRTVADTENQTESTRELLCDKAAFEPYAAFRHVSQFASIITSQRLRLFLAENDVNITKEDACYLLRLFNTTGNGKLTYNEFLNAVLPKRNLELCKQVQDRSEAHADQEQEIPRQIEATLARVFEEEVAAFKACEQVRRQLAQCEDFTIMNAFREFDIEDEGHIDVDKIVAFMTNIDQSLTKEQLGAFMLKVDKNLEGLIRYSDFLEVFYSNDVNYADEREPDSPIKKSPVKTNKSERNGDVFRTSFTSPTKTPKTPKKQAYNDGKILSMNGSFASPQMSTKMSIAYSPSYKTPTKFSASRIANDEQDFLNSTTSQIPAMSRSFYSASFTPKKGSSIKKKEENELVKALREMVESVRNLENLKNNLAVLNDFTVYNAFAVFDVEGKGSINSRELENGLNRLNIKVTKGDVALIMKKIDTDLDGIVRYQDWSQVVYPRSGEFAKMMTYKEPQYLSDVRDALGAFSQETLEAYKDFVRGIVEQEALHESIRQRLMNRKTFNLHDAYKALDRYENGVVTADQFKEYLEDNNVFSSQKDVNILVERYARSERGKVSYGEFIKEMTPKSVDRY